jgi:hypothetical protein
MKKMKKLVCMLVVMGLGLMVGQTAKATDLQLGPVAFKTYNWEISRGYDGTIGKTYFRDGSTPGYDAGNPDHLLFTDLSFSSFPSGPGLQTGEDLYGLLELTQLYDGTVTGGGTDIATGNKYWDKGDNGEYLRGMFWGGQDQRVFFADDGLGGKVTTVYTTNVQYNLYEMPSDFPVDGPQVNPLLDPANRDGTDYFTNWRGNGEGVLQAAGETTFFRFIGETTIGSANGQALVYLDVDAGEWAPLLDDFWTVPLSVGGLFDDTASTDLKQTWSILEEAGPWIKSEDVGKGYVIPEPTMMCLLGLGAFAQLRRRRS